MTLIEFKELLEKGGVPVFHYEAANAEYPYIIYSETEKSYASADDISIESCWRVQADLYTEAEFDPVAEDLERILDEEMLLSRRVLLYEYETKIIRHIFECEVPCYEE